MARPECAWQNALMVVNQCRKSLSTTSILVGVMTYMLWTVKGVWMGYYDSRQLPNLDIHWVHAGQLSLRHYIQYAACRRQEVGQ